VLSSLRRRAPDADDAAADAGATAAADAGSGRGCGRTQALKAKEGGTQTAKKDAIECPCRKTLEDAEQRTQGKERTTASGRRRGQTRAAEEGG